MDVLKRIGGRYSLAGLADEDGISQKTARNWRNAAQVGVKLSGTWFLTPREWDKCKTFAKTVKTREKIGGA